MRTTSDRTRRPQGCYLPEGLYDWKVPEGNATVKTENLRGLHHAPAATVCTKGVKRKGGKNVLTSGTLRICALAARSEAEESGHRISRIGLVVRTGDEAERMTHEIVVYMIRCIAAKETSIPDPVVETVAGCPEVEPHSRGCQRILRQQSRCELSEHLHLLSIDRWFGGVGGGDEARGTVDDGVRHPCPKRGTFNGLQKVPGGGALTCRLKGALSRAHSCSRR